MSGQEHICECLAAWVDSEPCICDEPIGAPMEVSASRLSEAERLVRHVRQMDRELMRLSRQAGAADNKRTYRTLIYTGADYTDGSLELQLPPDIAAGLVRTMRFHALVKLSQTGVVSTASGHRPVVSA